MTLDSKNLQETNYYGISTVPNSITNQFRNLKYLVPDAFWNMLNMFRRKKGYSGKVSAEVFCLY